MMVRKVPFLCSANSCRSQMAAGDTVTRAQRAARPWDVHGDGGMLEKPCAPEPDSPLEITRDRLF